MPEPARDALREAALALGCCAELGWDMCHWKGEKGVWDWIGWDCVGVGERTYSTTDAEQLAACEVQPDMWAALVELVWVFERHHLWGRGGGGGCAPEELGGGAGVGPGAGAGEM